MLVCSQQLSFLVPCARLSLISSIASLSVHGILYTFHASKLTTNQ